jgi:non-heme chloroperoxidase
MTLVQTSSGLRSGTAHLTTGITAHYVEKGDEEGEALVLLHGWPDSWFSFSRLLPLLPERYHAYAIDQRGFGDSDRPDGGYSIADLAADAVAFLDAVGVGRATFVGHSMGSFVARRVAETNPERVSRLVLIGSAVTAVNDVMLEVEGIVQDLEDPLPREFAREFQAGTIHVPVPEEFFEGIVAESLKLPARVWRRTFEGVMGADDSAELARIAAPTLILCGEDDALFSRADHERLAAAISGARLTVYPDTGHCPNWERPEVVAEDLSAFMSGIAAR